MSFRKLIMVKMILSGVIFLTLTTALALTPNLVLAQSGIDLRGRWDLIVEGHGQDLQYFTVYVGDQSVDGNTGDLLANGCMESPSNYQSPLAMKAEYLGNGSYYVSLASTVVPGDRGNPYVIQFFGPIHTFGKGVADDIGGGDDSRVRTEFFDGGKWIANHHDRRKQKCPSVEIPPLSFWGDVRAQYNLRGGQIESIKSIFEAQTSIVSSGVLVEKPDGSTVRLLPATDIFTPDIDFQNRFRYLIPYDEADDGDPIAGKAYYFTLLDVLGNPIPGSTITDVWTGCYITAPKNFSAELINDLDIKVSWDSVDSVDGFDPANNVGFYQIEIGGWQPWTEDLYGSRAQSAWHVVPWDDFIPPAPGIPDGEDLGVGLNKFPDGSFAIRIEAFSEPPSGSGGQIHECVVVDFDENLLFIKAGNSIEFE
jgi:hypothetical protein